MATTTATTDTEAALAAGVATPPESLEEYKELVAAETAKPIYQNIGDYGDADRGWTVQSGWTPPVPSDVPGQVYLPEQLPDPRVAAAAGLPPVVVPEALITDDENHPQGPEPLELASRDQRQAVREAAVAQYQERTKALEDAKASADTDADGESKRKITHKKTESAPAS